VAEVETSRDGGVLTITLNRPEAYNAFTTSMHLALGTALDEARADDVRAVVSAVTSAATSRRATTRTSAQSGRLRSR
jgi:enoyl-CoA hydratase/carnithine racemase